MKKLTLISLITIFFALNSFGQIKKSPINIQCASCKIPKESTCQPPDTINLYYDTCAKRIIEPTFDGLIAKTNYVFRICNVNSALYSIKISASNISRTPVLPTILSTLNGNLSSARIEHALTEGNFSDSYSVQNYYFFQRLRYDYNALQLITNQTKSLLDFLVINPDKNDLINSEAKRTLDNINKSLDEQKKEIISGLMSHLRNQKERTTSNTDSLINATAAQEEHDFSEFTKPGVYTLKDFKDLVTSMLADFGSRASLLFSPKTNLTDNLRTEEIVEIKRADTTIKAASSFLSKCPDIVYAILNSTCCIVSNPYQIKTDYFQYNIALLKPKFSDKPDTVSVNKINFYRVHYWKAIDVSTGVFYDNLASKAYYFKNTVPTQEIKSSTDISFGALFHSYWVFQSNLKAGPCAGIGLSVLDGKSKYFLGGSLLIGKNNELAISCGYAVASLPAISNLYQSNTITTTTTTTAVANGTSSSSVTGTTPSSSNTNTSSNTTTATTTTQPICTTGTVNTYNKYQGGIFVGITYSFLKL